MAEAVSTCSSLTARWEGGSPPREQVPGAGDTESHRASRSATSPAPAAPSRWMKLCDAVIHTLAQLGVCRVCWLLNCYFLSSFSFIFFFFFN